MTELHVLLTLTSPNTLSAMYCLLYDMITGNEGNRNVGAYTGHSLLLWATLVPTDIQFTTVIEYICEVFVLLVFFQWIFGMCPMTYL